MGEGHQPSAQPQTWRASRITLPLAPTLRPVWHGCPRQEYETPANIALGVTGERKPPHHDKVAILIEAVQLPITKPKYKSLFYQTLKYVGSYTWVCTRIY